MLRGTILDRLILVFILLNGYLINFYLSITERYLPGKTQNATKPCGAHRMAIWLMRCFSWPRWKVPQQQKQRRLADSKRQAERNKQLSPTTVATKQVGRLGRLGRLTYSGLIVVAVVAMKRKEKKMHTTHNIGQTGVLWVFLLKFGVVALISWIKKTTIVPIFILYL